MEAKKGLLLEGVDYYQVVFTLPSDLSSLALGNRREIYNLLFQSAWAAIKQTVESEQGYQPAALLVLHSWNQKLLSPRVPQGIGASLEARRTEVDRRVRFAPRETGLACVHRQVEGDGMGQLHPASAAASEQRTEFG
jgi:hypothetical protein